MKISSRPIKVFKKMNIRIFIIPSWSRNYILEKIMAASKDFYLRYYVGHKGKFGHEFLEFEFRPDGMFYVS